MGKKRGASARSAYPHHVLEAAGLSVPERKVPFEQLPNGHAALKGLKGEPVLDLGRTPVEGASPAQRGLV
jgi:hypothetical protein